MNRTQFAQYLDNPSLLNKNTANELSVLLNDYPYCQTLHLLYIKNLQLIDDIKFNKQLHTTAAYSGNRRKLYYYINKPFEKKEIPIKEQSKAKEEVITEKIEKRPEKNTSELALEYSYFDIEQEIQYDFEKWLAKNNLNLSSENYIEEIVEAKTIQETETIEEKNNIIEKFIKEQHGLIQTKKDFFNPLNLARQSEIDKEDLVSETLAKIYLKQLKYEKAISVYEKLIAIYPEKEESFRKEIEIIKSNII